MHKLVFLALLLIVLLCGAGEAQAQSIRSTPVRSYSKKEGRSIRGQLPPPQGSKKGNVRSRSAKWNKQSSKGKKVRNDYVLYRDVVRQYSWLVGLGEPISQDVANHLPIYYKLSSKNSAGNYLQVEAMHGAESKLVNKSYFYINYAAKWLMIPDPTGKNVMEERAYDTTRQGGNLLYSAQLIRTDDRHVTITYTDSLGLPIDVDESEEYVYGSVVQITYDSNGLDSIIDYHDGAGYRRSNPHGVDQERNYYDHKKRLVLHTTNNFVGDIVADNRYGEAGRRYDYNDNDNTFSITVIDTDLKPVQCQTDDDFSACSVITRDKWGRVVSEAFFDENGKPVALQGVYKVVYNYSDNGDGLPEEYYDMNNQKTKVE